MDEKEADDLGYLMRFKSRYISIRNWKRWKKITSREGNFMLKHVGGVVLDDVEVNIMVTGVGD